MTSQISERRNICLFLTGLAVLAALSVWGSEEGYYRLFLTSCGTNTTRIVALDSPLLIDTNNNSCKLTNFVVNLAEANASGQLGDIRLGMTMEQVVAAWGKPDGLYPRCYGGRRFCYAGGLSVVFDPSTNLVMKVMWIRHEPPSFPRFAGGLSPASSGIEDYLQVLGNPSRRTDGSEAGRAELVYEKPPATLRLSLTEGGLFSFSLSRLPQGRVPQH